MTIKSGGSDVAGAVANALRHVLGYLPDPDEDLRELLDSMQRLEILVALEQRLGFEFDALALREPWWASRAGVVAHVAEVLTRRVDAPPEPA